MTRLAVSLACGPYDRTEALRTGDVRPVGIDLRYVAFTEARRIFARMVKDEAFDLSEMSLAYYLARRIRGDFPFVALPVFPSRRFRHGFVFVNTDSGIREPKDLEGRKVGVPEYRVTAAVWVRGILQHEYGVDLTTIDWYGGGLNRPMSNSQFSSTMLSLDMVRPVQVTSIPHDDTMSAALARGDIDALISPRVPDSLASAPNVDRLIRDYVQVERESFRSTGIYPIMHTVVMRESLHRSDPWVAEVMYDAFVEAKRRAWTLLNRSGAARTMLPWQLDAVEEMASLFDGDIWPYGLDANRDNVATLMGYLVDQGFIEEMAEVDSLFAPVVEIDR